MVGGFFMQPVTISSNSAVKRFLMYGRLIFAGLFVVAMAASALAQASMPKPAPGTKRVHWHKYVNREYGFSFWYPDAYRPAKADDRCMDDDYRRYLLCLERSDNSEVIIWVTVVIAEPFKLYPDKSDTMPRRQLIGGHVFYSQVVGSMAVGFADNFDLNLKGKKLEFEFGPDDVGAPSTETRQLESKILKTFRTF
jgi:hypothetical protein